MAVKQCFFKMKIVENSALTLIFVQYMHKIALNLLMVLANSVHFSFFFL